MTRDHISINIINKNNYYEKDIFLLRTNCIFLTSCNDEQELVTDNGHGHTVQTDYAERTCNTHDYQHSLLQDADYKAKFDKRVEKMKGLTQSRSAIDCDEAIVLPVAVYFQSISNPNEACLKTLAQTQIDILNADYRAQNSVASLFDQVASNYLGVMPTDACIKFCLADQGHPSGSGIA